MIELRKHSSTTGAVDDAIDGAPRAVTGAATMRVDSVSRGGLSGGGVGDTSGIKLRIQKYSIIIFILNKDKYLVTK